MSDFGKFLSGLNARILTDKAQLFVMVVME